MKSISTLVILLGYSLVGYQAAAQTGVIVVGDVYVAPDGQVGIHTDELTLEADLQGDGNVTMAANTRQRIHAKGHTINRLTIQNPAGVDVVSDLVVTTALTIPVGELRLIDARLIVPNDGVIASIDLPRIHGVGRGALLIKSHAINPITRTGTPTTYSYRLMVAMLAACINWQGIDHTSSLTLSADLLTRIADEDTKIPAPPPKAAPFSPHRFKLYTVLIA